MKDVPQQAAFYKQLGENIRVSRKARSLSQETLAKLVGLTRTSLTNIESGRQHPPLHTLCEIAEQLQAGVSELLPKPASPAAPVDFKAMVGQQAHGDSELAFIKSGIGMIDGGSHGDTEAKN